ncbi:hypothetical protein [Exiguobacterium sp. s63]|uniref:hypothetical protein n=1 Tax=Exiguobacterium sp. s63 TaxID=2751274 RepID=UPI001BEAF6D5|nr:hypothetical protein [Exiguobacterium sp. s63]
MSKKLKINVIGWLFLIFLTISKMFFDDQLSIITTGLGGLICVIISVSMVLYGTGKKTNHANS